MTSLQVDLPVELLELSGLRTVAPGRAAAKLLALELYREERVSLGKAAELAGVSVEEFMVFSAERAVPLHYSSSEWQEDHQAAQLMAP